MNKRTGLIVVAAAALGLSACAREPRSAASGASGESFCDHMQTEAARLNCEEPAYNPSYSGGRADGAGGSHAPGSTGLGHGTNAADSFARSGSAR